MEIKSINSSLSENNLFVNKNNTNFDNIKVSNEDAKINNQADAEELALDDIEQYTSDYETVLNNNDNNSDTDYDSKIKNLNNYKENQFKAIEIIESEEKDIRNIVDDSYNDGYDILKSDYEKMKQDLDNEKNNIFSNYLDALTNEIYNNHYSEVITNSGLTKDKLLSMDYEDAIKLIIEYDNDAKEIIDSYEENIKLKFSNVIEELNKNGYNIKNMSSLIDYINYLDNQKKQAKSLIIEADKTLKILPYLDITNKDEYKNYEDNNLIDENILNLSFDGDNYSYSKYLSQKNISPADFLKQIEENDEYYNRGFALSEKNFDVNKLHNLIEASKSNSDLLKLYNYLYYNKGIDAVNKYLNDIEEEVNKSIALKHVIEFSNKLNDGQNIDDAANRTLTITGKGLTDGLEQFNNGLIYWFSDNPNRTVSDYETMYISLLLQPENIKKQAGLIDKNGKSTSPIDFSKDYSGNLNISDDVYAISTSIGNMLPSMMLSAVNPMIGTAALGITAGGNSYHERIIEGSDKGTAIVYGALSGLSEAALERVLGTLPGLSDTEVITLKDLLKAMPKEALEEGTQELFDIGLSHALYGEETSLEDAVARVGKSAIYGAITSGIMNTPGVTVNSASSLLTNISENMVIEAAKKYGINMTESEATEYLNYEKANESKINTETDEELIETISLGELKEELDNFAVTQAEKGSFFDTFKNIKNFNNKQDYSYNTNYPKFNDYFEYYNNGQTFGVDQGFLEQLFYYEVDGVRYTHKEIQVKIKKGEISPNSNIKKFGEEEYGRLRDKLINQGFGRHTAKMIISGLDSEGACSYAAICNGIFAKFAENPAEFKQTFGYDMFIQDKNGKTILNSGELLLDLYTFCNMEENGGRLFYRDEYGGINVRNSEISSETDVFGRALLNAENQRYMSGSWGISIGFIDRFLKSKSSNINLEHGIVFDNFLGMNIENKTMSKIIKNIEELMKKGYNVQLGIYQKTNAPIRMYELDSNNNLIGLTTTTTWNEGGGHAVFVTGIAPNGLYVSSWGGKYFIPFEDLQNGGPCVVNSWDFKIGNSTAQTFSNYFHVAGDL